MLVDWVWEEASSVVQSVRLGNGTFHVGEVARVWYGNGTYDGKVVASGK